MQDSIRQLEDEQENSLNYANGLPRLDLAVTSNDGKDPKEDFYKQQYEAA
jgi:hypothetical protein